MWDPTTSTASSSQSSSSDNKPLTKEVEVDDCKCSGSSSVGEQQLIDQQLQQQIGRNNSKHQQTSTFGGQQHKQQQHHQGDKATATEVGAESSLQDLEGGEEGGDNKKFLESTEEATDSGFISGPQTSSSSNIFPDTDKKPISASAGGSLSSKQLNITATADQKQKQQQYDSTNLDSGCIEVEEEEDFSDLDQQQQQKPQQQPTKDSQMLLKNNVDAGMSEWFCNLSLQNNPSGGSNTPAAASSQRSQQSMSVAGSGLNNLDAPNNKTRPTQQQQQQQQPLNRPSTLPTSVSLPSTTYAHQAAGSSASNLTQQPTQTGNIPKQITPANAWEHYYQQNDDGDTPLHLACISGYVDVVAALIRMSPHPCLYNIQNDEAQTPLHLATLTAQPKIIRMLLIAGAEPTLRDRHGNTALHLACISGEEQCVRALTIPISASEVHEAHRQYGHRANDKSYLKYAQLPSDLETRNYDGERCVHLAAQAGYIDILRILVLYGADINAREGKSGRTPLHIAIECCNEDLANFLLDECQKLNLETATYAGLTAYQVACALNKSEMQDILEKRGAEPLTPPDSDYDSSDVETDLDDSKYHRFGDPGYFLGYKGGNVMTVA